MSCESHSANLISCYALVAWREDCNVGRPHTSLRGLAPAECIARHASSFHEHLNELRRDMVAFRDRLEDLRSARLRVATPLDPRIQPQYFSCVFESAAWQRFVGRLDELASIEQRLATG